MMQGRVKWFNLNDGYGFIETDTHRHVLFHSDCIENGSCFSDVHENDKVFIEIRTGFKGPQAVRVRLSEKSSRS